MMNPKTAAVMTMTLVGFMFTAVEEKSDAEKLIGTWRVDSGERHGKPLEGVEKEVFARMEMIVSRDKVIVGPLGQEYACKLEPARKPKEITLTSAARSETILGIYLLEGDVLKLCLASRAPAEPRPTEFTTKETNHHTHLVLTRVGGSKTSSDAEAQLSEGAHCARSAQNLKYIGIALHNYHSDFNRLPPMATGLLGQKGRLSWRVAILPYLAEEKLYKEFKLDEPWDSEHNKKLVEKMPKLYELSGKPAERGQTYYRVFTGKGTLFEDPDGQRLADASDGLTNTILVVEAASSVIWSKPEELEYSADKSLPKLGGHYSERRLFLALFADVVVDEVRQDVDDKALRPFITRNDGQPVSRKTLAPQKEIK